MLWPKKCKLVIINLQWTPKDKKADLLIRGQSDQILCEVAKAFDIPISPYSESEDPLISFATALNENDPKPSTPFLNMVENNANFPGSEFRIMVGLHSHRWFQSKATTSRPISKNITRPAGTAKAWRKTSSN